MHSSTFSNTLRGVGLAAAVCGLAFAADSPADAKSKSKSKAHSAAWAFFHGHHGNGGHGKGGHGKGGHGKGGKGKGKPGPTQPFDEGELRLELHRGAILSPGVTTIATPNNCTSDLDLHIQWDEAKDRVRLRLWGRRALSRRPDVIRSDTQFRENQHALEPQNVENGDYRMWIIGAAGPMLSFHYDNETNELLGGGPGYLPPKQKSTTVIQLPSHYMFPTPRFQPNSAGDVKFEWTFSYSEPALGEHDDYSYYVLAYVPPTLCEHNPFRSDLTTYIPYVSGPMSRDEARPFSDYVRGGLTFEVNVHPPGEGGPPQKTTISTYSNTTTIGGTVPPRWSRDFDAAMAGLAPPIIPWVGVGSCKTEFAGFHAGENNCIPN